MRVLFANHTSDWSGAEVALLRLIHGLRDGEGVEPGVACPADGPLVDALEAAGIPHLDLPSVQANFAIHPVRTPRAVLQLGRAGLALRSAARAFDADLVHANSLRSGLSAAVAARLGCPPIVVQAHEHLPPGLGGRAIRSVLARSASALTAVTDEGVANLELGKPAYRRTPRAVRIYISIDLDRFDPTSVDTRAVRSALGVPAEAPLLAEVAQISPWKGQDVAIRALARVRERHPDTRLALIGHVAFAGTRYDNAAYETSLHELVRELDLEDAVMFLGQRTDVPELLAASDLSLLPSWDEPFGTVGAESMAMLTPPLVTQVGGVKEYVSDGENGRVLPPHEPEVWAVAIDELLSDTARRAEMGRLARSTAERFTDSAYAGEMMRLYEAALAAA